MDTSAGLTPFKKQKRDKKQKENGAASAKKDKPTVEYTLDPDHVTCRVRPCNQSRASDSERGFGSTERLTYVGCLS